MSLGIPVPSLAAAVDARALSSLQQVRSQLKRPRIDFLNASIDPQDIHDALMVGKICAYAQGFSVLAAAKSTLWPHLEMSDAARVWRQGCIIRSKLLENVRGAYLRTPQLPSLLLDQGIAEPLFATVDRLRKVVVVAQSECLPVPALASALTYLDSISAPRLWADVVQAQRDFFGQHGFKRLDKEGIQHGPWGA